MTKGEEIIGVQCCCERKDDGWIYTCLPCRIDAAIFEINEKYRKHLMNCMVDTTEVEQLRNLVEELQDYKWKYEDLCH